LFRLNYTVVYAVNASTVVVGTFEPSDKHQTRFTMALPSQSQAKKKRREEEKEYFHLVFLIFYHSTPIRLLDMFVF